MALKALPVALFPLLLVGCFDPSSQNSTVKTESVAGIPEGATIEKYPDRPGLEKVTVKNSGGALTAQGTILNGKKTGAWTEFNSNGTVKTVTAFVDGKREGSTIEFNENGQFTKIISYHNDLRNGPYKEVKYSVVKEERFYQDDKLEGMVKIYYDDGKIMEEGSYRNGTRDGISRWYDQNGVKTIEYEYKEGKLLTK